MTSRHTDPKDPESPPREEGTVLSFSEAASRKAANDSRPANPAASDAPARFEKHELQALFNLRAEYPNLVRDYVVSPQDDRPMVAFLESAGDPEPLAVFLKAQSGDESVYMVAGPGLATLSSNAMRDVVDHARDHMAAIQAARDSAARAAAARKGFKIV